jgi:hypothetical protein
MDGWDMNYKIAPILYTYIAHGAETAVLQQRAKGVHRGPLVVVDIGDIGDYRWAKPNHCVAITHTHRHTQRAYISVWVRDVSYSPEFWIREELKDLTELTEPTELTQPKEFTESTELTEPTQPKALTEPKELTKSEKSTEPKDHMKPIEHTKLNSHPYASPCPNTGPHPPYSEKKELCRTLRKGSVDFQKLQMCLKSQKNDKKFYRTLWRFCVLPNRRTISDRTFF